MPSAAAPAAAPAAAEAAPEEKPKEKTMFTVKLEAIDAAQKAKVIREVKAIMPNMNLVEVSLPSAILPHAIIDVGVVLTWRCKGEKVCRVNAADDQGEHAERRRRETTKDTASSRSDSLIVIGPSHRMHHNTHQLERNDHDHICFT